MPRPLALLALATFAVLAPAQPIITTLVGDARAFPSAGDPALQARLIAPWGIAVAPNGDVYFSDQDPVNNLVFRITPDGILHIVAGNGIDGFSGDGGPAVNASLSGPRGLALAPDGALLIADSTNHRIRRVRPDGVIETVAGNGDDSISGDGGPALEASLARPRDVAVDAAGNIFIADTDNHRIRQLTPDGLIRTIAGTGAPDFSGDRGPATEATLNSPQAIALDPAGVLHIADSLNDRIRQLGADGVIRTIAGNGDTGFTGDGGLAVNAALSTPSSLAIDSSGAIYIGDSENDRIRRISPAGVIQTIAGSGATGFAGDGGPALNASLGFPVGLAVDAAGGVLISDFQNNRLRRVGPDGVIDTIAGRGFAFFSGDGGSAADAALLNPEGVAVDLDGNLYISDSIDNRVRRIGLDGIISAVAGVGRFGFTGDGGPALDALLASPGGLVINPAGNVLIADSLAHKIRQVDQAGVITTIVGEGEAGFAGDGGPATAALLTEPRGLASDSDGNFYIADTENNRVRRVSPQGVITTIAGDGEDAFSGDNGDALNASLGRPRGVAVMAGVVFIADTENDRIRRVDRAGLIRTIAGDGDNDFAGDDGPALMASLSRPTDVAVNPNGGLLIADFNNNRVRAIDDAGVITTFAGNGQPRFSGDGGPAALAAVDRPQALALDREGNVFIAQHTGRLRVVMANPPRFENLPRPRIELTGASGGPPITAAPILITAAAIGVPLLRFATLPQVAFTATIDGQADWLTVTPAEGATPRLLKVRADPFALAPGDYEAAVQISMPHAQPAQRTLAVAFTVGEPKPAQLAVDAGSFSFTYPAGAPTRQETFAILNKGGGTLDVSITAETDAGGPWLSVSPATGTATPSAPLNVTASASPDGLPPGSYTGRILIEAAAQGSPSVIPVTMTISAVDQAILLTQSGLSFTAVQQGGVVPPQTFGVVNLGQGPMEWTVTTCTVPGTSCDWLRVTPDQGVSDPSVDVPQLTVSVDQANLAPGEYYGLIEIRSPAAANTPQFVTVFLEVLPAGSDPGAALTGADLVFSSVAGGPSPASQDVFVYNVAAQPKSFRSSRAIAAGRLEMLPTNAALNPEKPTRIVLQPFTDGAAAGEYSGTTTLQFDDGRVQEIRLRLIVTPAPAAGLKAQAACTPQRLLPSMRTLGAGFAVSAGWPVGLQVDVRDDCGQPITDGAVMVEFSNGDPELAMTSLRNGRWDGTWQTNAVELSDVTLRVEASQSGLTGMTEIRGGLRSRQRAPTVPPNGVVSASAIVAHQPLAPGSLISLFGLDLSEGLAAADSLPLPETIQASAIFIAGRPTPLLFASGGQVNALLPYGLSQNTSLQIVVQRGPTLSLPVAVNIAAAQPGVFKTNPLGTQGHVYRIVEGLQVLADPTRAAGAGEAVIIYCSGLGEVDPPVTAGQPAPSAEPLARTVNPVTVAIGGRQAQVFFSGLSPGFAGLYQINAIIPEGVTPGDAVELTLEIAGQTSQPVTIALQ